MEQSVTTGELRAGDGTVVSLAQGHFHLIRVNANASRAQLTLFNGDDPTERLSLGHTRVVGGRAFLGPPTSGIASNRRRIIARICEDDVRRHDILGGSLCETRLPDQVVSALRDRGIPEWSIPDPIHLFTPVAIDRDGRIRNELSPSRVGDRFAIFALQNLICAVAVVEGAVQASIFQRMPPKE